MTGEGGGGVPIQSERPHAVTPELLEGTDEVGDPGDAQVRERAGRGLLDGGSDADAAPFRDEEPVRADGLGRAGDRAEVVRVGDPIDRDEERRTS